MTPLSRRDLLKAGGALVVSFVFGAIPLAGEPQPHPQPARGASRSIWPKWTASSRSTPTGPSRSTPARSIVGTGMRIAIAQMAAEELGVAAERISIVDGDTALCPNQGGTGGSTGLTRGGTGVRRAAATARRELLNLGAARLNRPIAGLTIADGEVRPIAGGRGIGVGALVGWRPPVAQGRSRRAARCSGHIHRRRQADFQGPMCRPSAPADTFTFTTSACRECCTAGSIRPPTIGAALLSVKRSIGPRIFLMSAWCGSRASSQCSRGRVGGRACGARARGDVERVAGASPARRRCSRNGASVRSPEEVIAIVGVTSKGLDGSARRINATYYLPVQTHATIGPSCAVADFDDGKRRCGRHRRPRTRCGHELSVVTGLSRDTVRVVFIEGSGWYGRTAPTMPRPTHRCSSR